MRKQLIVPILLALVISLMNTSCSSNDDEGTGQSSEEQVADLQNNAGEGTWRVSNYTDSGDNETSDFSGYVFTFGDSGVLTATNGTVTLTGTWSVTNSSSSDDDGSSDDDIDFNIFFPVDDTSDFEDLNDDWDVQTYSDTEIRLRDVSGGDGSIDLLTFTKI